MGFPLLVNYRELSLESFANPKLLNPNCKLTEDIVKYVLPQFLEAAELCSLAHANLQWKHLVTKGTEIWSPKNLHFYIEHERLSFEVIESVFFHTLEKAKPLAEKLGVASEIQKVTLEDFPGRIEDVNFIAICKIFFPDAYIFPDDTLISYASKLRERIERDHTVRQLRELYFQRIGLTVLPKEIGFFTRLETLFLSNNQLSSITDSIGKLERLRKLYLSGNQLSSLPDTIGNLKDLRALYLSNNRLRFLPDTIGNLKKLRHLSLFNNQVSQLPDSIGKLTQ